MRLWPGLCTGTRWWSSQRSLRPHSWITAKRGNGEEERGRKRRKGKEGEEIGGRGRDGKGEKGN